MPVLPIFVVVLGASLYGARLTWRRRASSRALSRADLPQPSLCDSPADVAGVAVMATLAGRLAYPSLAVAGGLATAYNATPLAIQSVEDLARHGRADWRLLYSGTMVVMLLSGHYLSAALLDLVTRYGSELGADVRRALARAVTHRAGESVLPDTVWVEDRGVERLRPTSLLRSGDMVVVAAGELLPVDGVVRRGEGTIAASGQPGRERLVSRGSQLHLGDRLVNGKLFVRYR